MRKRIGTSLLLVAAILALPCWADKKKAAAEQYVVLYGTVFRDTGFALPDAGVELVPVVEPAKGSAKVKRMQTTSNGRGEFAFHLSTTPMSYVVRVSARGYQSQEKPVNVQSDDRIDLTFQLQPESK
jgi:hypothetical protein